MTVLKYSTAALALFFASSMAFAEDSTSTTTQSGAANKTMECPAAGTVAEANIPAECKNKAGTSASDTTITKTDSNNTAASTETPKTDTDTLTTGSTEVPKTTTDTSASSTTTTDTTVDTAATGTTPANMVLASQFMGQPVYSATNENVGEINDLVLNKDLDTVTAVIGVGGFLGIGEKDVAIPIDQIKVAKDENNALHLTIASTKEELEAAPAFDRTAQN